MTDLLLIKTPFGLKPADDFAREGLQRFKVGEVIKCKVTKPRNVGFHRKFFALVNVAFENQSRYEDMDVFLTVLKYMVGHCEWLDEVNPRGEVIKLPVPKSISFARMDQTEFEKFYGLVFTAIVTRVIPGIDEGELRQAVEERIVSFA